MWSSKSMEKRVFRLCTNEPATKLNVSFLVHVKDKSRTK